MSASRRLTLAFSVLVLFLSKVNSQAATAKSASSGNAANAMLFALHFDKPCPMNQYLGAYTMGYSDTPVVCGANANPSTCPKHTVCISLGVCCIEHSARFAPDAAMMLYQSGIYDDNFLCPRHLYVGHVRQNMFSDQPKPCKPNMPCGQEAECNSATYTCCYKMTLLGKQLNEMK